MSTEQLITNVGIQQQHMMVLMNQQDDQEDVVHQQSHEQPEWEHEEVRAKSHARTAFSVVSRDASVCNSFAILRIYLCVRHVFLFKGVPQQSRGGSDLGTVGPEGGGVAGTAARGAGDANAGTAGR